MDLSVIRLEDVERRWPGWAGVLAPDEREKMERYRRPEDAYRFGTTRAVVRRVLGRLLAMAPGQVTFAYNRFGKPRLSNPNPSGFTFSVSHTGGFALLGMALGRPVGVDLEEVRVDSSLGSLASAVCNARERREVESLAEPDRAPELFRYWTLKEAYVKALGVGLSFPHQQVEVRRNVRAGGGIDRTLGVRGRWSVFPVDDVAGYAGAVVAWGASVRLRRADLNWS